MKYICYLPNFPFFIKCFSDIDIECSTCCSTFPNEYIETIKTVFSSFLVTLCEGRASDLLCYSGSAIHIHKGMICCSNSSKCSNDPTPFSTCATNVTDNLKTRCNGYQWCPIISNSNHGNACKGGTKKYLVINYECRPKPSK